VIEHACEYPDCNKKGEAENFTIRALQGTPVDVANTWENPDIVGQNEWFCPEHFEIVLKERGFVE
jgi:hypothetical protein